MANGDLGGTTGTKYDPLLVEDALDLIAMQNLGDLFFGRNPNDDPYYVKQVADIDMAGYSWDNEMYGFMYYNGKMHTISNLTLDNTRFFGYATYDICGINFENCRLLGYASIQYTGSAYGYSPVMRNVNVTGTTSRGARVLGDYIGNWVLENVHADMFHDDDSEPNGGLAQVISDCKVKNCSVKTTLTGSTTLFGGGFAQVVHGGVIEHCSSEVVGTLRGSGFIGSLREGWNESDIPRIYDCTSKANIGGEAHGFSAGFVGIGANKAEIKDCYCSGTISDGVQMTGFAGLSVYSSDIEESCSEYYSDIIIENCYSLIDRITRNNYQGANQIYRFSPCSHINNANYVNSSMQFIDNYAPPEGMPPELLHVPFDDGIEVSGVTMPEHEYPVGFCPDAVPVHKCKTFYLN